MKPYLVVCLAVLAIARVGLASYYGEASDGYRPRCIPGRVRNQNLFFSWNEADRYERSIQVTLSRRPCSQWRSAISGLFLQRTTMTAYQDAVFGVRLNAPLLEALRQVRYGASILRQEATAEEWLRRHPISLYTYERNRALVRQYGMGFSGQVYRAWLESQPSNADFRRRYLDALDRVLQDPDPMRTSRERLGNNVRVLFAQGMGVDSMTNPATLARGLQRTLLEELSDYAPSPRNLAHRGMGSPATNRMLFRFQLEQELSSGKDVILVAYCKGAPELLAALADVTNGYLDAAGTQDRRPAGRGKVLAFIGLVPLYGGTFFGRYLERVPHYDTAGRLIERHAPTRSLRDFGAILDQVPLVSPTQMARFNQAWIQRIPKDIYFFNGIGIPEHPRGYYLNEGPVQRPAREKAVQWRLTDAANDGYIEYPLMQMPDPLPEHHFELVFDAPHILYEGRLAGHDLNTPQMRRALFHAFYLVLADMLR